LPARAQGHGRGGPPAPQLRLQPAAALPAGGPWAKGGGYAADTANEAPQRSPMDSRLLFRMAAPLVLTLLAPIAIGFDWPAPVRWAILTTQTLAWFGFAAWLLLRGSASSGPSREHARVIREQEQLRGGLRHFVGKESEGPRSESGRARGLSRQAVAGLGGSFDAMNRKSRQQSQAMARLIADQDGNGGVDVARFAQHASSRMEQLVEALEQVAGQS